VTTPNHTAIYPSLKGMSVAISGGATGIGAAIVRAFAAQGSKVGFFDIAADAGENLAAELTDAGHDATFICCDITDTGAYQAELARLAAQNGDILALVNNAANDKRHAWNELTPDEWDARVGVNLKHAFFAIQAVAPAMIEAGGGSIINFGSISWMILAGNMPAYTASKAAAHGLSRSLARDLGPHGIRVNTLVPGWVMTERQLELWVGEEENKLIDTTQALKGRVLPADIAAMALFLAADDSSMISAQDFLVDGGWAHN
jgi:D-xylose 1-dehydrogenase